MPEQRVSLSSAQSGIFHGHHRYRFHKYIQLPFKTNEGFGPQKKAVPNSHSFGVWKSVFQQKSILDLFLPIFSKLTLSFSLSILFLSKCYGSLYLLTVIVSPLHYFVLILQTKQADVLHLLLNQHISLSLLHSSVYSSSQDFLQIKAHQIKIPFSHQEIQQGILYYSNKLQVLFLLILLLFYQQQFIVLYLLFIL